MTRKPHDALFKAAFEAPAHAGGFFRGLLPDSLTSAIEWDTLQLEPGSYVDHELADQHSDLLFSARTGDDRVLLYLLLEHQSRNDPHMPYRLLVYISRIWERHLTLFGGPLPLIIRATSRWSAKIFTTRSFVRNFVSNSPSGESSP